MPRSPTSIPAFPRIANRDGPARTLHARDYVTPQQLRADPASFERQVADGLSENTDMHKDLIGHTCREWDVPNPVVRRGETAQNFNQFRCGNRQPYSEAFRFARSRYR